MCGIFGYIGDRHTGKTIKSALERLEYRGYDSAGITVKRENQLKTVKTIDGVLDLEAHIGSVGVGHCLAPDTKVVTSKGVIKDISDLEAEKVKSFDFEKYSETEKKYNKYCHNSPEKLYEIDSTYSAFEATGEHKLFVAEDGEIKTKKVKELSGEELIPAISKIPHEKISEPEFKKIEQKKKYKDLEFPQSTSEELLSIIGYHIGDGFISGDRTLRYKDADRQMLEMYNDKFEKVFNIRGNIHDRGGHHVLNVNSKYLVDWFKENLPKTLHKTGNEEVPEIIYKSRIEEVGAFVKGLFDAEGTVGLKSKQLSITMTSEKIIDHLKLLLLKGEVLCTKYTEERKGEENWSAAHTLSINFKEAITNFKKWAGFTCKNKKKALSKLEECYEGHTYKHSSCYETQDQTNLPPMQTGSLLSDQRLKELLDGEEKYQKMLDANIVWTRFEVSEIDSKYEKVYDLEVEDTKSFYAAGTIQHNSRWASHGDVTEANAHPHTDCAERFAIVHNGIIENYEELKDKLYKNTEHKYTSETDSEVIAHWIENDLGTHCSTIPQTLQLFKSQAEGNYAIAVIDKEEDAIYAIRNGSPLVIGIGEGENFVASDLYAFSQYTDKAYFLEEGEVAKVTRDEVTAGNQKVQGEHFEWTREEKELGDYDHWMRKEIDEIPGAIQDYLDSIIGDQSQRINDIAEKLKSSDKVIFAASGSSYHAALIGVYYLQKAGIEAQALIASEFENYERVDENTTVVAVSQSGETRDVLDAISYSREKDADIVSLVNVPNSTIQRESDYSLEIRAGQEICVAATKTFVNQVVSLMSIAQRLGYDINLSELPSKVSGEITKAETKAEKFVEELEDERDIYVIGKGETYPVSREISLKLKEIAYNHSEGMMAGELKHGTLALVEDGTPLIALEGEDSIDSSVSEVESRGAEVTKISSVNNDYLPIYASIYGFLLSYKLGVEKGLAIDKPKNLAKVISVG